LVSAPGRFILADIGLIERALTNLVDNAVKFTPSGGRVRVGVAERNGRVTVTVADSGVGISAQDLPHIFDRFYRVEAGPPGATGTGLGLAIVKRVAELHAGRLDADSTPGEGSVFRLELPARPVGLHGPARAIPAPSRANAARAAASEG
jgi:two-component system heavy metal sensor histidine kinase CusS